MIKKLFLSILVASITYCQGFSQLENSLLWKVSGNELNTPSYLYGTLHSVCESTVYISASLEKVIKTSDKVFLEIDFNENLNDFKNNYDYYLKNGRELRSYFSSSDYLKLEEVFNQKMKPYNTRLSEYKHFKPAQILLQVVPKIHPCTKWTSYEEMISTIARKAKKPIFGLETYSEHNSFETQSDSAIIAEAKQLFRIFADKSVSNSMIQQYDEMLKLYQNQEIEKMYSFSREARSDGESEKILDFRNKIWIPRIVENSSEGQILYAFGAAHLAGENGVINLLRKEGFIVTPVF